MVGTTHHGHAQARCSPNWQSAGVAVPELRKKPRRLVPVDGGLILLGRPILNSFWRSPYARVPAATSVAVLDSFLVHRDNLTSRRCDEGRPATVQPAGPKNDISTRRSRRPQVCVPCLANGGTTLLYRPKTCREPIGHKNAVHMHQGRKSLYQRGIEQHGPYQSPTEDGMLHFHEYLRRNLETQL